MPRTIHEGRYRARATPQHTAILPTEIPIPKDERNPVPDVRAAGLRWYVCTTVPQGERRAAASLRREADSLNARGLAPLVAYVPCATDWRARKRGELVLPRREIQTPCIRSYVFVGAAGGLKPGHLNAMSEQDVERRNRHGLIAVLGRVAREDAAGEATCALSLPMVDIDVMAAWAERERTDAKATDYRAYLARQAEIAAGEAAERAKKGPAFAAGETVTVAAGPFASFNALVLGLDIERTRMLAEVSIFGRATPIELDFSDVRKAA